MTVEQIIKKLKSKGKKKNVEGMSRFGMTSEKRLGVPVPEMRKLAKEIGPNHSLALKLWRTGIPEARIVAGLVAEPDKLTEKQMDNWIKGFNSWDVCDQVCMNLFDKSPFAWKKAKEWTKRKPEFEKRAGFALIAVLAWHDKEAEDKKLIQFLPIIKREAKDERNYVKKAVNWALRHIGKRNSALNKKAIKTAKEIQKIDDKTARWVANNAIRELESEAVQKRLDKNK